MDRTTFSLEVFGDRLKPMNYGGATNEKQISQMKNMLLHAMDTELTEKQREITKDFYFGGLSVTEISSKQNVNKSTVSRHLKRSKEKLQKALSYGFLHVWEDAN